MNDFDLEQQLIEGRMKRYGQQGYQAPQGEMVGNQYVAPNILQHLAAGLRGYGAIKGQTGAEQELKDLQGKRREAETKDMSAFVSALRGTPAQPAFEAAGPAQQGPQTADPLGLDGGQAASNGGYQVPAQAAKPGDLMSAYSMAAASQSPTVRQMGIQGMAQMPQMEAQKQERMDNRAFRAQESELARQARAQELEMRSQDQRLSQAERLQAAKESREMMMQNQRQMQQIALANRPERNVTVMGPNGEAITMPQSQAQGMPLYNPQAAKEFQKNKTKAEAKEQLSGNVAQLGTYYDTLEKGGGIVSTEKGGFDNLLARASSTGLGQAIGGAFGNENQTAREKIEQARPLLLNFIKEATGMSAQQMNSNAEMQLYLKAATDPKLSVQANREALANLDKMFGLGLAKYPGDDGKPPAAAPKFDQAKEQRYQEWLKSQGR